MYLAMTMAGRYLKIFSGFHKDALYSLEDGKIICSRFQTGKCHLKSHHPYISKAGEVKEAVHMCSYILNCTKLFCGSMMHGGRTHPDVV